MKNPKIQNKKLCYCDDGEGHYNILCFFFIKFTLVKLNSEKHDLKQQ